MCSLGEITRTNILNDQHTQSRIDSFFLSSKGHSLGKISHVNLHTHPLFWFLIGWEVVMETAGQSGLWGSHMTGSHMTETGSDVTGTGSDVIWKGKPLTSRKKHRRLMAGKNRWPVMKKGSQAHGPLTSAGSEAKVQFRHGVEVLTGKRQKKMSCWKIMF